MDDLLTDPEVKDFLLGLYAGPLEAITVIPLSVKMSGAWREATMFVKVGGVWKATTIHVKADGTWKS